MSDTKTQLVEVEALLASEASKWNELGFHPDNINGIFSQELFFIVAMKLDALITYLQEKDIIIDKDDFQLHHRRKTFTKLREIRERLQEQQKTQQSGFVTPRPTLLGPDGNPVARSNRIQ